jgi:hypothetical protein
MSFTILCKDMIVKTIERTVAVTHSQHGQEYAVEACCRQASWIFPKNVQTLHIAEMVLLE